MGAGLALFLACISHEMIFLFFFFFLVSSWIKRGPVVYNKYKKRPSFHLFLLNKKKEKAPLNHRAKPRQPAHHPLHSEEHSSRPRHSPAPSHLQSSSTRGTESNIFNMCVYNLNIHCKRRTIHDILLRTTYYIIQCGMQQPHQVVSKLYCSEKHQNARYVCTSK